MPTCPVDARPTENVLCPGCAASLTTELRQIPWLVEQLNITLTRQARIGDRNGPRGSERPLPYDHAASVDLETVHDTLALWCTEIAERRSITPPTGSSSDLARWLMLWPSDLAGHPDAAEMHGQILSIAASARRTIDRRPDLRFVGPCDSHGAETVGTEYSQGCGKEMYAHPRAIYVTCRTLDCGASYPMDMRRAWLLEAAYDRLLTAAEMSRAIRELVPGKDVTPNRISQWAARGRITKYLPHPRDPHKRARFRVEDVIVLASEQHTHSERATA